MTSSPVKFIKKEVLSKNWSTLTKYTYKYLTPEGWWQTQTREAYDRGNGMVALLYNKNKESVILTQQFRLPTFLNGNSSGFMIEACAGKLEEESPEAGMIREIEEETGHKIVDMEKIFEIYMSPGSVTELLHFYIAQYDDTTKISAGGGLDHEQENIEVLEIPFDRALEMIKAGEIKDAKTIMLLQHLALKMR